MIRPNIGIDTSVLVRLVTGQPPNLFTLCVERLSALSAEDAEIFASNQVIGEAYVALQHHYGVSKEDARRDSHHPYQRPGRPAERARRAGRPCPPAAPACSTA